MVVMSEKERGRHREDFPIMYSLPTPSASCAGCPLRKSCPAVHIEKALVAIGRWVAESLRRAKR